MRFSQVATQSATIKRDNTYGPTISSIMFSISSWVTKSSGINCIWDENYLQVIAKSAKYVAYYSQGCHPGAFRWHKLRNLGIKSFTYPLRDVGGNGGSRGIRAPRLGSHSLAKTGICGSSTNALIGLAPSFIQDKLRSSRDGHVSLLSSLGSYTHYLLLVNWACYLVEVVAMVTSSLFTQTNGTLKIDSSTTYLEFELILPLICSSSIIQRPCIQQDILEYASIEYSLSSWYSTSEQSNKDCETCATRITLSKSKPQS